MEDKLQSGTSWAVASGISFALTSLKGNEKVKVKVTLLLHLCADFCKLLFLGVKTVGV
jgi:hypothetical protein